MMIQKWLRTSLMTALMFVTAFVYADRITYADGIVYEGQVKDNKPFGLGTLTLTYNNGTEMDLLEGNFAFIKKEGKTTTLSVTDATLMIARYNGPNWKNRCVFKGKVACDVDVEDYKEDRSMYLSMEDGQLSDAQNNTLDLTPDNKIRVTRVLTSDACRTIVHPFSTKQQGVLNAQTTRQLTDRFAPFPIMELDVTGVEIVDEITLNSNWLLERREKVSPILGGGVRMRISPSYDNTENLTIRDGRNRFTFTLGSNKFSVRRSFGSIDLYPHASYEKKSGGMIFAVIRLETEKGVYDGLLTHEGKDWSGLYQKLMKSATFSETGLKFYLGKLITPDGKTIYYKDGVNQNEASKQAQAAQQAPEAPKAIAVPQKGVYECTSDDVKVYMGAGANTQQVISDGGMKNPYPYGDPFLLYKGARLRFDGVYKNGFMQVLLIADTPYFTGPNDELNSGWVEAKYLKQVKP